MTPRSLFVVILRVLGILFIRELLNAVPQFLWNFSMLGSRTGGSDPLVMVIVSLITVAVHLSICYHLIFKADWLVTKLSLDKGFKQDVLALNLSVESLLRIAIVVAAAFVLLTNIPDFFQIMYRLIYVSDLSFNESDKPDWSPAIVSGVKIVLALLLIGERKTVLALLMDKKTDPTSDGDGGTVEREQLEFPSAQKEDFNEKS